MSTVPIHLLASEIDKKIENMNFIKCLPAMHHLTGSDYTSKLGTKHKVMNIDPSKYLTYFGRCNVSF